MKRSAEDSAADPLVPAPDAPEAAAALPAAAVAAAATDAIAAEPPRKKKRKKHSSPVHAFVGRLNMCMKGNDVDAAVTILDEMEAAKLAPTQYMYTCLLNLCCTARPEVATRVYEGFRARDDLEHNEPIYTALVKLHVGRGDMAEAAATLQRMIDDEFVPKLRTFSPMLIGHCKSTCQGGGGRGGVLCARVCVCVCVYVGGGGVGCEWVWGGVCYG